MVVKEEKENKKVEMKSGIEIHQQLDTGKLFCRCPSILRNEKGDWVARRKLHAVAGESGRVDLAAKHERDKNKEFIYEGFSDTCCLIEYDEEPPLQMDKEALKIVLQVALLLNCEILPVTQIMRKTVIDGSNTSGFQRTTLVARNGFIETSFGRVGIDGVCIEEDSARTIEQASDHVTYRLDRLGIPLIEIATAPDIYYPEQVKEAALKIGEILRACKVKRGLGTIRQDINLSIPGGVRVEIKGFQDPSMMTRTVELEILRQKTMLEIHGKVGDAKEIKEEFLELNKVFASTQCKIIKNVLDNNGKVYGAKIVDFVGLLGKELYENKRFGSEVSDYAKVFGVGGMIHSDENLEKYNLTNEEINAIKKELGIKGDKDAWIIIADEKEKASKAIIAAIRRINLAIKQAGIKEVRKANTDGSTSFMRPMPGADRMYPETDLPLLKISRDFINEVRNSLPKLRSDIKGELKQKGLSDEMINLVLDSGRINEYELLLGIYHNPNFIAKTLFVLPKEIASHEKINPDKMEEIFSFDLLESILKKVADKTINENDVKHILEQVAKGKTLEEALKLDKIDLSEIEGEIAKIVKEKPGLNANAYMGLAMSKFKGKVSGKDIMEILGKLGKSLK